MCCVCFCLYFKLKIGIRKLMNVKPFTSTGRRVHWKKRQNHEKFKRLCSLNLNERKDIDTQTASYSLPLLACTRWRTKCVLLLFVLIQRKLAGGGLINVTDERKKKSKQTKYAICHEVEMPNVHNTLLLASIFTNFFQIVRLIRVFCEYDSTIFTINLVRFIQSLNAWTWFLIDIAVVYKSVTAQSLCPLFCCCCCCFIRKVCLYNKVIRISAKLPTPLIITNNGRIIFMTKKMKLLVCHKLSRMFDSGLKVFELFLALSFCKHLEYLKKKNC